MKLAILGDIHGNAHALDVVLKAAKKMQVDYLLVNGDLVGYYFMADEVLKLLEPWQKYIVRGNHEDMLIKARKDVNALPYIEKRYGSAIEETLRTLGEEQLDMLCELKHPLDLEMDGLKILLCHGTPWDNDVYVYPDAEQALLEKCALPEYDIVIMGHTHYPMIKKVANTQLVNPGSVGQPRNRKPGAHWALLDTDTKEITLHNEAYDASSLIADVKLRHPELPYLAEVLTRI